MTTNIHTSSVVETGAQIAADVTIGPFCHVGADVKLGEGSVLHSHEPQDLKYHGEENSLTIGDNCTIREGVTINPGTEGDDGKTIIGNNCFFLANAHVAHIPYGIALGNRAYLGGLNLVGMKRAGIDRESINKARKAFKDIFNSDVPITDAVKIAEQEMGDDQVVSAILEFIKASDNRSLCTPRSGREG